MDKVLYVLLAVVLVAALGTGYTMFANQDSEDDQWGGLFTEYDDQVEATLGLNPSKSVDILERPSLPTYDYPLRPIEDMEFIVYLRGEENISNKDLIQGFLNIEDQVKHKFLLYGKTMNDEWIFVDREDTAGESYQELVVSLLLIDWEGLAFKEEDFSQVKEVADLLAGEIGWTTDYVETPKQAGKRAEKLSGFYQEYAVPVGIVLEADPDQPFTGPEIHDVALSLGLHWGEYDGYHWPNYPYTVGDDYLFSIYNYDPAGFVPEEMVKDDFSASKIVFEFFIPTAPKPAEIYQNMVRAVRYFQQQLGGTICSVDGQELDSEDLKWMGQVIGEIAQELEEKGYIPGHDKALWLFSE